MIDRYKIIIWAKPKELKLSVQVDRVYEILNKIEEFSGQSLLLPAKNKIKVKTFNVEKESIEQLILHNKDKMFPNLGSELAFFTSLEKEKSMNIHFSVGRSNSDFVNSMTISLPINYTKENIIASIELFKSLSSLYDSFYACITSNLNLKLYDYNKWFDYDNQVPKVMFWVNYWGKDIIKKLRGVDKIKDFVYEYQMMSDGNYVRLQKEPIDSMNIQHIELQKKVNNILMN